MTDILWSVLFVVAGMVGLVAVGMILGSLIYVWDVKKRGKQSLFDRIMDALDRFWWKVLGDD